MAEKIQRDFRGEIIPAAFSAGGAVVGGILGGGVGAIPGATVGGAIGEGIQQKLEQIGEVRKDFNPAQVVGQGIISGATQGVGNLAFKGLQIAKPIFVKLISKASGFADDVLEKAFTRTPGVIEGVRKGEAALVDVVKKTALGIQKKAGELLAEGKKIVANLSKLSVKIKAFPETQQFMSGINNILRAENNIGITKEGKLVFSRINQPSRIVSGSDRATIQEAYNSLASINNNTSIKHIDSVFEKLLVLRSKTPVGTPTGAETKAILRDMIDYVHSFLNKVPAEYGTAYKEYAKYLTENLPKRVAIGDAKEIFGYGILSPKEITLIESRMLSLYNTGKLPIKELAEQVGKQTGEDIVGTTAGTLIGTGKPVASGIQTRQIARGFFEKIFEAIPRSVVKNYIATGKITGEFTNNPIIKNLVELTGVSANIIMRDLVNLMANKTKE